MKRVTFKHEDGKHEVIVPYSDKETITISSNLFELLMDKSGYKKVSVEIISGDDYDE